MSVISSTTGHNQKSERRMARVLYVCIGVAILFFALIYLLPSGPSRTTPSNELMGTDVGAPTNPAGTTETPTAAPTPPTTPTN